MRIAIAATLAVTAGLVVANMLGVAAAEAPTATPTATTPVRTVSVEGVATVPVAQDADLEAATAAYRQGMADAVTDGQSKAEFLAGKVAGTLGPVQSVTEDGGSISCLGEESEGSRYAEYEGEQPDFGSGRTISVAPVEAAAPVSRPPAARKVAKKHTTAKKSSAVTCKLEAQLSLVYTLD
jgi:hypothetical protein